MFVERFRATQLKYGTIPASVLAAVVIVGKQLFSARNWKQASQFVGDLFKSDKSDQYGQQQTVIQKIKLLKKEIGKTPCSVLSFIAGEKFGRWWGLLEEKIEKTGVPKYGSAPEKKLRIIVFMDGLDRYEDSVIVQVLRSLNTVLQTCEINFVLALDKNIIRKAFKTTSQKEKEEDADHFISQIIELTVTLHPVSQARPSDSFRATSDQMQGNNEKDIENQQNHPSLVKEPVLKPVTQVQNMSEMMTNDYYEEDKIFENLKRFSREISGIHQDYIKYHMFARNVISQIIGDGNLDFENWYKELVAWIFICSQWRSEMNILIQDWHAYVEVKGQNGEPSLKEIVANYIKEQADIKGKNKNAADSKENGMKEVDSKEAYKKENGEKLNGDIRRWKSLQKALEVQDVSMKGIQCFQHFRFHCDAGYLNRPS